LEAYLTMSSILVDLASAHRDSDAMLDVPTMMKLLMVVYENLHDDAVMDEVAEAVGDAICMLGDMRNVAQQVMSEGAMPEGDLAAEFDQLIGRPHNCKPC